MTAKTFINNIANGKSDVIQWLLNLLDKLKIDYCVIGGLAVNAYVEPVVSLDLDVVVTVDEIEKLLAEAGKSFTIEKFPHSINLKSDSSDLRIQLQTDKRYQEFIARGMVKDVMGYKMKVASVEDIFLGKTWAYADSQRRMSKRQKDLADLYRLIEAYPNLKELVTEEMKKLFQ